MAQTLKIDTWQENDGEWITKIYFRSTTIFGYGKTEGASILDAKSTLKNYK
jgi:hypothetical protein